MATVFTLGITLGCIPAALLTTRLGARPMLAASALFFSACTAWSALASSATSLLVSRVAGGLGEAVFNVALFTFLAAQLPRFKGAAAGGPATVFGIGLFSGPLVVAALLRLSASWQGPFFALSGFGILGGLAIWLLLPKEAATPAAVDTGSQPLTLDRVFGVLHTSGALLPAAAVDGIAIYS